MDKPLEGNYQGNLADICPVGALTSKKFRFQARVWNLSKTLSTCGECSRGCSISVEALRAKEVKRIRPRYNAAVNQWWMCDTGRHALAPLTRPLAPEGAVLGGRLRGAAVRGYNGLELADDVAALDLAADMLAAHPGAVVIVSPFATQEEAKAALALAQALKATPQFVSPAPNALKDDLLHTGDPCPNRRGLVEQGFAALEPAAALAALAAAPSAVLAGERVLELLGHEGLAKLPTKLRLIAFDVETSDIPALDVAFPVPTHVEKSGHWVNLDGHVGVLNVAVPPPSGVRRLDAQLAALAAKLSAVPARS